MKLAEFQKQLDLAVKNGRKEQEELEVCVPCQGIGGSASKVTGVYVGFDWYAGRICLQTEDSLAKVSLNKFAWFREQYIKKNSNLKQIREKLTLEAVWKKERQVFPTMWGAIEWLYEKADEDYQKNK